MDFSPLQSGAVDAALASPFFGLALTLAAFRLGQWVNDKLHSPLTNPFAIALVVIIAFLQLTGIPLAAYETGAHILTFLLLPATAMLGVSIYARRTLLVRNFLPILAGCLAGSVASLGSVYYLCRLFGIDGAIAASLLPKSVTTPIAMEISQMAGGIVPISIASVILTGIFGVVLFPPILRALNIDDPLIAGVAIGTASHALGTAKAIELGETEGAASGVALCVTGVMTVVIFLLLFH